MSVVQSEFDLHGANFLIQLSRHGVAVVVNLFECPHRESSGACTSEPAAALGSVAVAALLPFAPFVSRTVLVDAAPPAVAVSSGLQNSSESPTTAFASALALRLAKHWGGSGGAAPNGDLPIAKVGMVYVSCGVRTAIGLEQLTSPELAAVAMREAAALMIRKSAPSSTNSTN